MILQVTIALPVVAAALLATTGRWLPRLVVDASATLTVLAVTALDAAILTRSAHHPPVEWPGGWGPGTGVGIVLTADPFAAGLATTISLLALAALAFSWRYFTEVQAIFHTLLLLFVGAMSAFVFTGDLFDAFVFFELMTVVAFALTGYRSEEPSTVHGALNFGIINSLGAYLTLTGIALVYARTGELGLAATGRHLHDSTAERPGALVTAAFVLIACGFLVKAAAVPFHFWLADAHAVAPTPLCVLFSGVMVELGVYAVARTYWSAFEGLVSLRALAVLGAAGALLGAVMCLLQHNIKRLLAYSTISHAGILLVGVAVSAEPGAAHTTTGHDALAGTAFYLAGHAGVKGALFLCAGALLNRHQSVDEHHLRGRGHDMPITRTVFLLAALGLAGLPPSGAWAGKSLTDHAAAQIGWWWAAPLTVAASALTAGAALRVWLRVFRGAGPGDGQGEGEDTETRRPLRTLPWTMAAPGIVLTAAALLLGALPGHALTGAAAAFTDRHAQAALILDGDATHIAAAYTRAAPPHPWTISGVAAVLVTLALAAAIAALTLRTGPDPGHSQAPRLLTRAARATTTRLHAAHSGHIGDYAAWLIGGAALLAILTATTT